MKKVIAFMGGLLCSYAVEAVEVKLSAFEVFQGDSLSLSITDSKPIGQVDLSPLSKDFVFGGQQRGQSSRFINGVGSTTYELGVVLFPTKTGEIQIPPLKVGNETTEPLMLKVVAPDAQSISNDSVSPSVQLKAHVSNDIPYVGQGLFYTVQLIDDAGIVSGEVLPGQNDKIRITPVGQDSEKVSVQNGRKVRVIERTYLLVPQESGSFEITPAVFNGQIAYQSPKKKTSRPLFGFLDGADIFQNFMAATRPVQIISNPVEIQVKGQPANWSGWWLPSTDVQLNAAYQQPDDLKTGDVVQVELTLSALDVDANNMPVVKIPSGPDFRIYPEPEERITQMTPDGHIKGVVKTKFSLVPFKVGMMEIPAIQVPWFNTRTNQTEMAQIEAYPLKVAAGEAAQPVLEQALPVHAIPVPQTQPASDHFWSGILWGLGIGMVIFGVFGIVLWRLVRSKERKKIEKKKPIPDFYPFK